MTGIQFVTDEKGRKEKGIPYEQYAALNNLTIKEGRGLQKGDEVIVDANWQQERGVTIGSTIEIFERPFKLVGVYEPPGGGRIKIPLTAMQDQVGSENRCNTILVACDDANQQEQVAARIQLSQPRVHRGPIHHDIRHIHQAADRFCYFGRWDFVALRQHPDQLAQRR